MKRNDGFTLIELLVTISVGALVTIAAASLLLLGARVQHATTREAEEQQTVRIVMSLLEKMAGSGDFDAIRTTYTGWQLLKTPDEVKFEYVSAEQALYRGAYGGESTENEVLLTGLRNAAVTMEGNVIRLAFETKGGANYVTRVYCRTAEAADAQAEVPDEAAVKDFYEENSSLDDSAGRVAVRQYDADANVIMGRGVLPQFLTDQ